jgi:sugar-specific transcriptional regulator TrmB
MSQNTTTLLQNLGLTIKQSEIFLLLYQYGAKPASSIAKMMG